MWTEPGLLDSRFRKRISLYSGQLKLQQHMPHVQPFNHTHTGTHTYARTHTRRDTHTHTHPQTYFARPRGIIEPWPARPESAEHGAAPARTTKTSLAPARVPWAGPPAHGART